MMSDLHWTGAALLLAVATLGGSASRGRQSTEVSWDVFAREHGIGADGPPAAPPPDTTNAVVPAAKRTMPVNRGITVAAERGAAMSSGIGAAAERGAASNGGSPLAAR